jgi:tRNA A-37 threonylcarbamoyl transferase component Bud32
VIDKKIIKEKIFTNLKNYYPDRKLFIKGVTFVKNERARVLRYDLFEDDNKINEIYVKILKEGVKEQVLELKKLNEQRDLLLMPRILDFFEDFNAVVMEGFQGATLTKTLIFYTLPIAKNLHENRLLDIVKYIGRALGFLHNFTEKGKLRIGDMNLGIINGVKINHYIRTLLGTDLFNIICNRIGEIENERVSFVQVHRDPTPHNILVKGDDVCFVDFSFSRGASFEDPLTFSTGLELMSNRLPYFSKLLQ